MPSQLLLAAVAPIAALLPSPPTHTAPHLGTASRTVPLLLLLLLLKLSRQQLLLGQKHGGHDSGAPLSEQVSVRERGQEGRRVRGDMMVVRRSASPSEGGVGGRMRGVGRQGAHHGPLAPNQSDPLPPCTPHCPPSLTSPHTPSWDLPPPCLARRIQRAKHLSHLPAAALTPASAPAQSVCSLQGGREAVVGAGAEI